MKFPIKNKDLFKLKETLDGLYKNSYQYECYYNYVDTYHGNFLISNNLEGVCLVWKGNPFNLKDIYEEIRVRKIK